MSVDPITSSYPNYTPYLFAGNTPIKFIDLGGLEPAEPGTYKGKGAIAPQIDECGDACAGTNNYRWTWGNDQWNKVDFNVTITELKSIFKKGKSDALQQIEMQVNLDGANYGITTKKSLAHFLSKAGHEVGGFSKGLNRIESYISIMYIVMLNYLEMFLSFFSNSGNILDFFNGTKFCTSFSELFWI